ncbi:MAG: hypothetical protein ACRDH6_03845 [Actinomycetota bacterium]
MQTTPSSDFAAQLDRVERDVAGGNLDLSTLGFWRLVAQVKRDPALRDLFADRIGAIDRLAFEGRVRVRFPLWLGTLVLLAGAGVGALAIPVGLGLARGEGTFGWLSVGRSPQLGGLVLLASALVLTVALHSPTHVIVGRLLGIRFLAYFIGGPIPVTPGAKIEYSSYLRASPGARAVMHAAGAVVSKAAPFVVFAFAYLAHRAREYELLPAWSLWTVLGVGLFQLLTDATLSRRYSDWKKVARELRIARSDSGRA